MTSNLLSCQTRVFHHFKNSFWRSLLKIIKEENWNRHIRPYTCITIPLKKSSHYVDIKKKKQKQNRENQLLKNHTVNPPKLLCSVEKFDMPFFFCPYYTGFPLICLGLFFQAARFHIYSIRIPGFPSNMHPHIPKLILMQRLFPIITSPMFNSLHLSARRII